MEEMMERLLQKTVEVITTDELIDKIKKKKKLRVKLGIDPSAPDIHLGHAVVLRKLREFQDAGHTGVLIVGNFTAMIGDPTGRSRTRPQLTREQVEENIKRYREQVFKILDPDRTEFLYNNDWLGEMKAKDVIELASKYTVARMLERDDFSKRLKEQKPLHIHEILYPLFQGYDSVYVKSDVELGGTDQKFNFMVARALQVEFGLEPQVVITMHLLEGTDGVRKMSKSYGNHIGISDPPFEMFGKIMSIPDSLITKYFYLCTDYSEDKVKEIEERMKKGENPRDWKFTLAQEIVKIYHGEEAAKSAGEEFNRVFKNKEVPREMPVYLLKEEKRLMEIVVEAGLLSSRSEYRRKLKEGAIYLDSERVKDINFALKPPCDKVVKVGKKKFLKVVSER